MSTTNSLLDSNFINKLLAEDNIFSQGYRSVPAYQQSDEELKLLEAMKERIRIQEEQRKIRGY